MSRLHSFIHGAINLDVPLEKIEVPTFDDEDEDETAEGAAAEDIDDQHIALGDLLRPGHGAETSDADAGEEEDEDDVKDEL